MWISPQFKHRSPIIGLFASTSPIIFVSHFYSLLSKKRMKVLPIRNLITYINYAFEASTLATYNLQQHMERGFQQTWYDSSDFLISLQKTD